MLFIALLFIPLVLAGPPKPSPQRSELDVSAPAGRIIGHYAKNGTLNTVREFLGIPYARPPVGDLRFAPPVRAPKLSKPLKADIFGPACLPARYNSPTLGNSPITIAKPLREDEDCLSVNVWTPSSKRIPKGGAAVMLWVYGGGFMVGSSDSPLYNGANIVRDQEGVVIVTLNRVNVFGFPAFPSGKYKNPGLMDVRAAVEWTRDNIAAFGNPRKITLFGQSAGGASTDSYLFYAAKDPIIRAAIPQSGTITSIASGQPAVPGTLWNRLAANLSCTAPIFNETLKCMRAVPAGKLRDAVQDNSIQFGPAIDNTTIFSDLAARLQDGRFARIPVMVGTTDQEIFGTSPESAAGTKTRFTCPAHRSAGAHTKLTPTWLYRWFGNFPSQGALGSLGPFHGSELSSIFGTYNQAIATPEQIEASKFMQRAWTAFAKDPVHGLQKLGWPRYNPEKPSYIGLVINNAPNATVLDSKAYTEGCPA